MSQQSNLWILVTSLSISLFTVSTNLHANPQNGQSTARPPLGIKTANFAPNRILVKFKASAKNQLPTNGINMATASNAAATTLGNVGLTQASISKLTSLGVQVQRTFNKVGVSRVVTNRDVSQTIEALLRSGLVEYAEPAYQVKASAFPTDPPNDPRYAELWGLNQESDVDIDAPEAWKIRNNATTSIVGVVDTGVDYNHEDLRANMWKNPLEIANNGIDDDANGYIDDIYGIDTYNYDSDPMDDAGHGTHVSGTIGAKGNNNLGVIGVAPNVKIMGLKFLGADGSGYTDAAIEAINYLIAIKQAHQNRTDAANYQRMILSNSWGGGEYSNALYDAINNAKNANILFIAAAGNDGINTDTWMQYPAGYDIANVVSVGSSTSSEDVSYFSNYGCASVDLFAPGSDILSTVPTSLYSSGYEVFSGTSMATPHVSGAAALLWAKAASSTNWSKVKAALMNSVEQQPAYADKAISQGRLNLLNALSSVNLNKPSIFSASPSRFSNGDTVLISGINFGNTAGTITFNDVPLTINSWSNTEISVVIPAALAYGKGSFNVTTAGGNTSTVGGCGRLQAPSMSAVGNTIIPRAWASSAQVGKTLWVMGGRVPWALNTGLVESINLNSLKPQTLINSDWMMPDSISNASSAAIGSKIYVVGGLRDTNGDGIEEAQKSLQIFDTTSKTWSYGKPLPKALSQAAVVALGNKLFVFGGIDDYGTVLRSNYMYDPATNAWAARKAMPTSRTFAQAIRLGTTNKAMVVGGFYSPYLGTEYDVVEVYNANTNTWSKISSMQYTRAAMAAAFIGKPIVAGGSGTSMDTGEAYISGSWEEILSSPTLYNPASAAVNNYFFSVGGIDLTTWNYSNTIYRFQP